MSDIKLFILHFESNCVLKLLAVQLNINTLNIMSKVLHPSQRNWKVKLNALHCEDCGNVVAIPSTVCRKIAYFSMLF